MKTIDVRLNTGAREIVVGTEVLDREEHCLVVKDGDRVVAWFDWANIVGWSETAATAGTA